MNVDYKNAEQFESIARSEGFHDLDVMGNGCYADDFLQHFYLGWHASREEGEPIGFLQSSGVSELSGGHPARLYPIGATPSPFESSTLVYTHPARDGQDSVAVVNKASTGEYEFYPSSNLVDIPNGMHKLYTHPASAAKQAVSVPSILYDGYAVFQEVQHARNSKGLKKIKDSALVSDVLDAVVKLIKQEKGQ